MKRPVPRALFSTRRADSGDLVQLLRLFLQYREFYRMPARPDDARRFLVERLANGDSLILVAELTSRAGTLIGFAQLFSSISSLGLSSVCILNDLFVVDQFRKRGVARALMQEAQRRAKEAGASRVVLETAPNNVSARTLYESLGYQIESGFLQYSLSLTGHTRSAETAGSPPQRLPVLNDRHGTDRPDT